MPQVDHFGTRRLQYAAHDINGRIMPVKQRSGCYKAYLIFGMIGCNGFHWRCLEHKAKKNTVKLCVHNNWMGKSANKTEPDANQVLFLKFAGISVIPSFWLSSFPQLFSPSSWSRCP